MNLTLLYYPQLDFHTAIRAEGDPVTFQIGGDANGGDAFLAGVPGCFNSLVNELSDILCCVVVVDAEAAKLLLYLADFHRRV